MDCRSAVAITPNCYITSKSGFVKSFAKRGFGPFGEISDFLSTLMEIISGKGYFIDDSNEYKFIYVRAQSSLKHGVRQNHFITFCLLQCITGPSSPLLHASEITLIYFVVHLAETIWYNTIKLSQFEVQDLHRQHNLPLKLSKMYRL